ncbi:MBL fold metallo-hydrolase [Streptomyces koyangensis]
MEPDRMGIATALVVDSATYLIDCGRAAATQYMRASLRFDGLQAVLLTHLHSDHVPPAEYEEASWRSQDQTPQSA